MSTRIALVTQRDVSVGTGRQIAYGAWSEAEDVLIEAAGADLDLVRIDVPIEHPRIRARRSLGRTLRRVRGPDARLPGLLPRSNPSRVLSGRYDVVVFVAFAIWDLQLIERLGRLRNRADRVVVWFFETWPSSHADGHVANEPFTAVDDIYLGAEWAVEPLADLTGREIQYLPMATDTLRFGPDHPASERPIDLIGIGRRRQDQHDAMLEWATERDRFYLYDSTDLARPKDYRRHRDAIGRRYAGSKLAVCNYGKSDQPELTGDLRTIPGRLWESLASGACLVGIPPDESMQRRVLGRTVVEPMPSDAADLPAFLEEMLNRHGPRAIADNVRLALHGHDWAHRWIELFDRLDLTPPPALGLRAAELQRRAEKFGPADDRA
ncbi:MAG: hypothetical protein AAGA93_04670 [Actinomycetota bacterium]